MRLPRALRAVVAATLVAALGPCAASAKELAPRSQALLLLRVLAYDRNLERRAGTAVKVIVLAREGDRASERRAGQLVAAFTGVAGEVVVAGHPVTAEALPVRDAAALAARLEAARAALVYVDEALAPLLVDVVRTTRRLAVLSAGGSRGFVEAGVAVAIVSRVDRAGVLVNLPAAKLEGASLESGLLAVAEVVRE